MSLESGSVHDNLRIANAVTCPLCGEANGCTYAAGRPHEECWCKAAEFPEDILDRIPPAQRRKSCICQRCVEDYTKRANA